MKTAENIQANASSGNGAKPAFFPKPGSPTAVHSAVKAKPLPFFNATNGVQRQADIGTHDSSNDVHTTEGPKVFTKPKSFWVMENDNGKNRSRAIYSAEPVTMAQLTHAIYKNPQPMLDSFSSHNGKTADQEIPAYTRIRIPKVNTEATGWAINGFSSSLIFKGAARNPFPILEAMGVSSPADFARKKKTIEQELEIEKPLMSMNIRIGMEDNFIKMLKKYAERNFTEYPDRYSSGGQYVDKIFLYLRSDFKKIGSFDQITSSYDLIFNHFKRANEVRQIREFHSAMFVGDDGIREVSYSAVFLEEAFEKALTVAGVPKTEIMAFLNKAGDAIADIIAGPKKFLGNLIGAVKLGFKQFVGELPNNLGPKLLDWVLEKIGVGNVEIPKDFSVKSILKLALQSLQITPEHLKDMVSEVVGPENVAKVEKVWGVIKTFMKHGITGLVDQLITYVGDLKTTLVDKLKNWILKDLVKSAISDLLQMFIPGGGLVKVVKKIYGIIQFVRSKMSDLKELFTTVGQSVLQIVKGDISTAAMNINQALKKGLYLLIDLLARLMKINFLDGIKNAIQNLRTKIVGGIKKLVEKILVGGTDALGRVKNKFLEWWDIRKEFKTKSGEDHKIYFKKNNENTELYVASTPTSFSAFIKNLDIDLGDSKKVQSKKLAIEIASNLHKITYNRPAKNLSDAELSTFYRKKNREIKKHMNDLSNPLSEIMDSQELPTGSYDNPIPIRWTKRGMINAIRDLIPKDRNWTTSGMKPPDPIEVSPVNGKTKLEIPPTMTKKFAEEKTEIKEGQEIRYIEIGVDNSNIMKPKAKIQRSTRNRKDSVKNRFRNTLLVANYNYEMGAYDMDHILDLGFGGKDSIPNLWPLYREMNQNFGTKVYHQVVSYTDEKGKVRLGKPKDLKGKWFIVESIGDL